MASWKSFEDIEVWQLSRFFCKDIYRITKYKGLCTDYKLKDQINSSSGSIMDNIAEGYGRDGNNEFIQFLSIAKGSATESKSQLYRINDRNYTLKEEYDSLIAKIDEIINKLGSLIYYLKNSNYKGLEYKRNPEH